MIIPQMATIKLWIYGTVIAVIGVMAAMLKIKSAKIELAKEKIKAKDKQIKESVKANEIQAEQLELSRNAKEIRNKIARMSSDDVDSGLSKHYRD